VSGFPVHDFHRVVHRHRRELRGVKTYASGCREDVLSACTVLVGNESYTTALNCTFRGLFCPHALICRVYG
jgi:hypothetical protein